MNFVNRGSEQKISDLPFYKANYVEPSTDALKIYNSQG